MDFTAWKLHRARPAFAATSAVAEAPVTDRLQGNHSLGSISRAPRLAAI